MVKPQIKPFVPNSDLEMLLEFGWEGNLLSPDVPWLSDGHSIIAKNIISSKKNSKPDDS